MQAKHDLFISYHTPDRDPVTSVRQFLEARGISSFIDREHLVAGLPWPQALEQGLKSVSAMAVFLGPRGLGHWQKREIGFALDRQVKEERDGRVFPVIPVLLPGADPISGFLFLNTWVDLRHNVNDSSGLEALARAISGERVEPLTETSEVILPYRGLESFREEHAAFFCGREAFSKRLLMATLSSNLIAVVGPSGSGKSSVVQAGLIPALRRQLPPVDTWDAVVFTPGDRPYHSLAAALIPLLEPDLSETKRLMEAETLGTALADGKVRLEGAVNRLLEKSEGTDRLLLVADQFEELFTTVPEADRKPFITTLMHTRSNSPVSLLLTLRADFYGNALSLSQALSDALENGIVNLGPMRREELERAIIVPAERVGFVFEPGLVTRILDEVAEQPGYLPLLEFALTELWALREDRQLTHNSYGAIGGVAGALTQRAETEFSELTDEQQKTARRVFTHLVRVAQPEEGSEDTRKRTTLAELGEAARAVVKELTRARLLVTGGEELGEGELHGPAEAAGKGSSERAEVDFSARNTVEVAHEALIRGWDRLRSWLDEDREFLLWQQRLRATVAEWERTAHDQGTLLRGAPLVKAERRFIERPEDFTPTERTFIQASQTLREEKRAASKAQRKREARVRHQINWVLAVVIMFAVVITIVAVKQRSLIYRLTESAHKAADEAKKQAELARRSIYNIQLALVPALGRLNSEQVRELLEDETLWPLTDYLNFNFKWRPGYRRSKMRMTLTGHTGRIYSMAFSPYGKTLASASRDKTIKLWDAETGQERATLTGHTGWVYSVAFSPDGKTFSPDDGKTLASASRDKTIKLWDAETGQERATLTGHTGWVLSVAFSPYGKTLASASRDKTIKLWDAETGQERATLTGHTGWVLSVAFSPDGKTLASASRDKTIKLWDAETGQERATLTGHTGWVLSVAFSPDGKTLASASRDKTIKLWDAETGQERATLTGHTDAVNSVAFSLDGKTLASVSADNTIKLWDAETGQERATLTGHTDAVNSVAFSPDSNRLASASSEIPSGVREAAQ